MTFAVNEMIIVSVIQMDCVLKDKKRNLERAEEFIAVAAARGSQLIVLPEMFSTGYRVEDCDAELAELVPGATTAWMQAQAEKYQAYITGGIIERDGEEIYDTAVIAGPDNYLFKYRKMHLWGGEPPRFGHGDSLEIAELPFAKVGLLVCYEIGFPEQARVLTFKGADILIYTSAFGKARAYVWVVASCSRALENGVFVLACNRCGCDLDSEFGGLSRIVAPNAAVLAGAGADGEAVVTAAVNLSDIPKQRNAIPYLRDLNSRLKINTI